MKTYIISWKDGSKIIVKGTSFVDACNNANLSCSKIILDAVEYTEIANEKISENTCPPNISSESQEKKDYKIVMQFLDEAHKLHHALKYSDMLPTTYQEMLNELSKDLCKQIRNNK